MSIIFRIFVVKINQIPIIDMIHNFCTKYGKILEICKQYSKNLSNISCNHGKNIPPPTSIHHITPLAKSNGKQPTAPQKTCPTNCL